MAGVSDKQARSWGRRVALLGGVAFLAFVAVGLAATPQWRSGLKAMLPANASSSNPTVFLTSVSCASAGDCAAVGFYRDSSNDFQGLLVSESAGKWSKAVDATLPANAASNPGVFLQSVSCASAGNCSAVGWYNDSSGNREGLLVSESSGTWGTGVEAALPTGAGSPQSVSLQSVSCASAGNCAAVGDYLDGSGNFQGLLVSESSGTWGPGVEATLPAGAISSAGVNLSSVSCASAGNCSAVGGYKDSPNDYQGLLVSESSGTWGMGVEATLPTGAGSSPSVLLNSVSCASAGSCTAVGLYTDGSGNQQGLLLSESSGTWGTGVDATPPAGAASNPAFFLSSVSCASAGNCSAVGTYNDGSAIHQGVLLSQSSGTWGTGVEATPPANAGSDPHVFLGSVSCASAGNCTAVGTYNDSSGNSQGLLVSESLGTWGTGVEATLPANAGSTNPVFGLSSVSCASADNCSAVGEYKDRSNRLQGLLLDEDRTLTVSVAGSGTVSGSGIACPGACSHIYPSGTIVRLIRTPKAGSLFAGWSGACTGTGPCEVTMSSDQAITATFRRLPPKITSVMIDRKGHHAKFSFQATGPSTGFQCALIKQGQTPEPGFASCTSPKLYTGLTPGTYTFEVRAMTNAGPTPFSKSQFTI